MDDKTKAELELQIIYEYFHNCEIKEEFNNRIRKYYDDIRENLIDVKGARLDDDDRYNKIIV